MSASRGITLYLHVHQPWRVREYSVFDMANQHNYFSEPSSPDQDNELILHKVAEKSYLPMNALLEKLLDRHDDFKLSLSISGVFLEQCETFAPEIIDSFRRLVNTGRVEILSSPYYHSLAFLYDQAEFEAHVEMHRQKIFDIFGVRTQVFANTELAYNDQLAQWAEQYGFTGILAEGWDPILDWRSPNYVYRPAGTERIGLLLKNYRLSDDLAFRFGNQSWVDWPLTTDKYHDWARSSTAEAPLINLFMDYETFGEHQWRETGIFMFFEQFVERWLDDPDHTFYTVSEAIDTHPASGEISMPNIVTWADSERDMTAWLGNSLQTEALKNLYQLRSAVLASEDLGLISDWRKLQSSDHVYYMSTKWADDGNVHAYFSPYDSPHDAFLYYMNALRDMRWRLNADRYGD